MWGVHWRNMANTNVPSICGGDAAFLLNYSDHLFVVSCVVIAFQMSFAFVIISAMDYLCAK